MNKKFLMISILLIIISFSLGWFLYGKINFCDKDLEFKRGWESAKQRLLETGFIEQEKLMPVEVKNISGTIAKVEGNIIYINIRPVSPLSDPILDQREVVVGEGIDIIRTIKKSEEQYAKEMLEFNKNGIKSAESSNAPSLYFDENIKFSDLKAGDDIIVFSENDIQNEKRFTPQNIKVK